MVVCAVGQLQCCCLFPGQSSSFAGMPRSGIEEAKQVNESQTPSFSGPGFVAFSRADEVMQRLASC